MKALPLLACVLLTGTLSAQSAYSTSSDDDWDADWPDDDWSVEHVNEGELEFLAEPPADVVHHHENVLTLDLSSLDDGWVLLEQCHRNIDKVPRAQIIFRPGRIRNLQITVSENIGRAWVEDASVQLNDVGRDSRLCLSAETRALTSSEDGSYRIDNGPFMRRFLDGYYPMRVSQKVVLADSGLAFFGIRPEVQPGFDVNVTNDSIHFDAWFEGRLLTEIELVPDD